MAKRNGRALLHWFTSSVPKSSRYRPQFEQLEDRAVPTTVTDTSGGVDAGAYIGAIAAHSLFPNVTGKGYSVAVLDTGINYNSPDFGGGWGNRVIAGYNFVNNTSDPMDDNGHGSIDAGIIGSSNPLFPGIAPDVNLIALKVLDQNNSGTWTNIDCALQWVIANQAKYNIVAVNLSLGSGNYTTNPTTMLSSDFAALVKQEVFISVAAGNDFYKDASKPGLDYPAIDPNVVSVGSVWAGNFGYNNFASGAVDNTTASDQIMSESQRASNLDLLAPGAWIESDWFDGTLHVMGGSSMAAASVSGAAVLLHQELTATGRTILTNQFNLLKIMQNTGVSVVDNSTAGNITPTGLTFKRINLLAAMQSIAPAPPVLTAIPNQTRSHSQGPLILTLSATDPQTLPINYSASIVSNGSITPASVSVTGKQLTLTPNVNFAGSYQVQVIASDGILSSSQTFNVTITNTPPTLASIANQSMSHRSALTIPLYGSDADGDALTYTASISFSSQSNPATLVISGNQLNVTPAPGFLGDFIVMVNVTDGVATASTTFTISVTNAAPVITVPTTVALNAGQTTQSITIPTSDADGDTVTLSASVVPPDPKVVALKQQLGLLSSASAYYNLFGLNEKWLQGSLGSWYLLMPNGQIYRFQTNQAQTITPYNLVATLDPSYYANPSLLTNVPTISTAGLSASMQGNTLVITRPANLKGSFLLNLSATDGLTTVTKTIQLILY